MKKLPISKTLAIVPAATCLTLLLFSGCSQGAGGSDLKSLQAENTALKNQIQELQSQLAKYEDNQTAARQKTQAGESEFTDLDDELPTTQYIRDLAKLGVFKDLGPEFKPYDTITRAEYVTWLFKAYNTIAPGANKIQLAPSFDPEFSDISPSHPAYKYVASLANAGYSVGYDDKTFKPDQPITREEMLAIKLGFDLGKTIQPDPGAMKYTWKFSDSDQVDKRYTGYIYKDKSLIPFSNITRVFGEIGTFKPKQAVMRHEAAASLWAFKSPGIYKLRATDALERLEKNH